MSGVSKTIRLVACVMAWLFFVVACCLVAECLWAIQISKQIQSDNPDINQLPGFNWILAGSSLLAVVTVFIALWITKKAFRK
ncbi:MAG TPA: hypothetical protein VHG89_07535 [Verrucomicrobiae bacterium]|nr:hypothetical protein [Verrucomicrobiae bacterium]